MPKENIHPKAGTVPVKCSCGHETTIYSVLAPELEKGKGPAELRVEVCSRCHPHYTGEEKIMDSAGRIERYRRKYQNKVKKSGDSASAA